MGHLQVHDPFNLHKIGSLVTMFRIQQRSDKPLFISQDQHPFTVRIEPSNRIDRWR
jgi:hypothetical protein